MTSREHYAALAVLAIAEHRAANERYAAAMKDSQLAAFRELVFTAAANDIPEVWLEPSDQGDYMTLTGISFDDDLVELLEDAATDLPDTRSSHWADLPGVLYEDSKRRGDRATINVRVAAEALLNPTDNKEN